jgi:hypothetical protein
MPGLVPGIQLTPGARFALDPHDKRRDGGGTASRHFGKCG